MSKMTDMQNHVLEQLRRHCRLQAGRYAGGKDDYLHKKDLERLRRGDQSAVFGLGGLTFQIGHQLNMTPAKVLRIFKALREKGLVISEEKGDYQRPLYWWPVGLAAEITAELLEASA